MANDYLKWLSSETPSAFWHDSAVLGEAEAAFADGAVGMTTNPFLINATINADPATWKPLLADLPADLKGPGRAEEAMRRVTTFLAEKVKPFYDKTDGKQGYVCAQTNPNKPCDYDLMLEQARRYAKWAPNIAVKLPTTAAGVKVFEECAAEGISVVATVAFTVPQCLAVGEAYKRGVERARKAGIKPGIGVAVLMVGRLDDYLKEVWKNEGVVCVPGVLEWAGIAAFKGAYTICRQKKYTTRFLAAAYRNVMQWAELVGGDMVLTITQTGRKASTGPVSTLLRAWTVRSTPGSSIPWKSISPSSTAPTNRTG